MQLRKVFYVCSLTWCLASAGLIIIDKIQACACFAFSVTLCSGNSMWRGGYRLWVLEGMAEERQGTEGHCALTAALLAQTDLEGLWEVQIINCSSRKDCWSLVLCWVVRNCMWILLLGSSLVWSPGKMMEAVQLYQHFCTSFCWQSSSACNLSVDQGVSPTMLS